MSSHKIKYKVVQYNRCSIFSPPRYILKYKKNTTVRAMKHTLGIMVFKHLKDAENFAKECCENTHLILRVETIGRGKTPKKICPGSRHPKNRFDYDNFYSQLRKGLFISHNIVTPPEGTICYPAVKVLT